jgi:hypothetical protein
MKVTPLALYLLASNLFLIALGSSTSGNTNDDLFSPGYCNVCADGRNPLNLETQLGLNLTSDENPYTVFNHNPIKNVLLTCGNAQANLEKYEVLADDFRCDSIQFAGIERCGCPDLRINECNLCEDEKDKFNPDTLVPDKYQGKITCFELAAEISSVNDETCSAYQVTFGERCGCSKVRDVQCRTLCGPADAIPDPQRIFGGSTCESVDLYYTFD